MSLKNKNVTINNVLYRLLPITKSVELGLESEPKKTDFTFLKELGSGSFGRVFLVQHKKTNAQFALKTIDKRLLVDEEEKANFLREVEIIYKIHHPNIVKLYGHFEDDTYCYLLMEYIEGGELYSYMPESGEQLLDTKQLASIVRDIISAIYYLHHMNPPVMHRDIKPENVLINSKMKAKLTDFGWSNYFTPGEKRYSICGTPIYLAPEMIKGTGHDEKVDIWSIGVLLFELLTGEQAWAGENIQTVQNNICNLKISWPANMNKAAEDLISKILKTNPKERPSLKDILNHSFFTQYFANSTSCLKAPDNKKKYKPFIISKDEPVVWNIINGEENYEENHPLKPNNKYDYLFDVIDKLRTEYIELPKEEDNTNSTLNNSNKNNFGNALSHDSDIWGTTSYNLNENESYPIDNSLFDQIFSDNNSNNTIKPIENDNLGFGNNSTEFGNIFGYNQQNNYNTTFNDFKETNNINQKGKENQGKEIGEIISYDYYDNNNKIDSDQNLQKKGQQDFSEYQDYFF